MFLHTCVKGNGGITRSCCNGTRLREIAVDPAANPRCAMFGGAGYIHLLIALGYVHSPEGARASVGGDRLPPERPALASHSSNIPLSASCCSGVNGTSSVMAKDALPLLQPGHDTNTKARVLKSRNFPDAHNELACWDVSDCSATWSRTEHAQPPPSLSAPPDRACVPGSRGSPR